ncbi:MAG: phosphatase PAP2 family protein [bacterium]|nr:phosphatase PAP2 family protein [bacterium]
MNWISNGMDNLIIFCAKYLIFFIPVILVIILTLLKGKTRWQFASAVILAGVTAVIFSKIAGALYSHPRPFISQHTVPLVSYAGDNNSFPSDHTLLATTLATAVYFYRRRVGILLLGLAVVVGIGRVLAHVHWAIDILGGLILGAVAGFIGYQLARKLLPVNNQTPKPKNPEPHT